ncbi:GNAT family N-acetyltransferase [Bermanella sp. R86510]|uniref:GNAT family N-acetyltransferase n=1 Tax=unclassified Bermanella TaxID=2627862 RepID=UPI0037C9BF37
MIRKFKQSDFEQVANIYSRSKLDELRFETEVFNLLPIKDDEKRLRELMESQVFVYEDDTILGYGAIYKNEIRALFIHPEFRSQGIGGSLLSYLVANAEAPAKLYVAKSNAPAKSMYVKYGFIVTQEFETSYNGMPVLANEMVRLNHDTCDDIHLSV